MMCESGRDCLRCVSRRVRRAGVSRLPCLRRGCFCLGGFCSPRFSWISFTWISFSLTFFFLALSGLVCASTPPAVGTSDLQAELDTLYGEYAGRLEQLASKLEKEGTAEEAAAARGWLPARRSNELTLFVLPDRQAVGAPAPDKAAGESKPSAGGEFKTLRNAQAEALFRLAHSAAEADRQATATQLLTETVRENPDHADARRALGYVRHEGQWVSPYSKRMMEAGFVWDDRYGWLRAGDVSRYEAGQRRFGRRWLSAEEDARRRRAIERGWRVRTDYYEVTTNKSLEAGVRLAEKLERLGKVWRQMFADYYLRDGELADVLAGKRPPRPAPSAVNKYQVLFYRSRDEYNAALRKEQPQIDMTLGIYLDRKRRAYFFDGEEQDRGTLLHEATHQLFQQSRPVRNDVGQRGNFWIVEGVATYMESLAEEKLDVEVRPHDTERRGEQAANDRGAPAAGHRVAGERVACYRLGGFERGRMPAACYRLLKSKYYIPLSEMTRMTVNDIQRHPEIAKLYSQVAGLTTFLMHFEGGRYRAALGRYLVAVYAGRADHDKLSELTGADYAELDKQYRRFVMSGVVLEEEDDQADGR